MTTNQMLSADLNDIIFEHRNKAYGAYAIRKAYPGHLKKAVLVMLSFVAVLCMIAFKKPAKNPVIACEFQIDTLTVNLENYKEPQKPKEPQRTVAAQPITKVDRPIVIIPDDQDLKHPPVDRTDTTTYTPGHVDHAAIGDGGNNFVQGKVDSVTNLKHTTISNQSPEPPAILTVSEVQPEFPGGTEAWMNYLQRMLRVPDELESGDRKTVRVKFVVNATGEITDAVIVQSAGNAFDKEVLRVIAKMPKWKPGKQYGKPVAVYFTQPVTFTINED